MLRNILFLLIIFLILNTNNVYSQPNILKTFNNIVIHENPKDLPVLEIINKKGNKIIFNDFSSKLTLINFWATWCAPCKKELPKLDSLNRQIKESQLKIILINIENIKYNKIQTFFNDLKIVNLDSYFDNKLRLAKELQLRGLPITIIINSKGKEIGRIIGDLDFTDQRVVSWIKNQ
tara:strand:+ start:867 stop:1397 length:531 start_codon:yes stop_codon:yes gene_type:complete